MKKLISLWQQNKGAFVGEYIETTVKDSMSDVGGGGGVCVIEEHQTPAETQAELVKSLLNLYREPPFKCIDINIIQKFSDADGWL